MPPEAPVQKVPTDWSSPPAYRVVLRQVRHVHLTHGYEDGTLCWQATQRRTLLKGSRR
jgi:hypothetical protein